MAPSVEQQVRLYRDSQALAWGFKLQGGLEYRMPLTVQRVFVGSPADGALHRGDVIVAIDNYDASQMLHRQAMDLIKRASNSLILRLRRAQSIKSTPGFQPVSKTSGHPGLQHHQQTASPAASAAASAPAQQLPYRSQTLDTRTAKSPQPLQHHQTAAASSRPMESYYGGHGYDNNYWPADDNYDHRGQRAASEHSLEEFSGQFQQQSSLWGEETIDSQDPEYEQRSVNELKQLFGKANQRQYGGYSSFTLPARRTVSAPHHRPAQHAAQSSSAGNNGSLPRRPAWHKPNVSTNPAPGYLLEPGWSPKSPKGAQANPWVATSPSPAGGAGGQQQVSPRGRSAPHQRQSNAAAPPYIASPPLRQYRPSEENEQDFVTPAAWAGSLKSPSGGVGIGAGGAAHTNNHHQTSPWETQQSFDHEPDYRSDGGWENDYHQHSSPFHQPAKQSPTRQQPINKQHFQQQPISKPQFQQQPVNKAQTHPVHKPQPINSTAPRPQQQPAHQNVPQHFNRPANKQQQQQPVNRPAQQQKPAYRPQPTVAKQQHSTASKPHEQHYNNPGGLYSQKNATANQYKPNKGQLVVTGVTPAKKTFNLAQSETFRLVAEEQEAHKGQVGQGKAFPFATYTDRDESDYVISPPPMHAHQRQGASTLKQTPLLYELNQQYSVDETGVSDF